MTTKIFVRPFVITLCLLLIPVLATIFIQEMTWGPEDFIAAFVLLLSAGVTYELIAKYATSTKKKALLAGILLTVLFLTWVELAVGIFN